jgi:hypothetical protein
MNPLLAQKIQYHSRFYRVVLCFFALFSICSCQADIQPKYEARSADPGYDYGFSVDGFTPEQEILISDTLEAYAQALGGSAVLRDLILSDHQGMVRPIIYNPHGVGANNEIMLSPTVFSLELSGAAQYPNYAAGSEAEHARIVIGHEIAHILLDTAREPTGRDWAKEYEQRVSRNWAWMALLRKPVLAEEEAVTELSLKVLHAGYYFCLYTGEAETDTQVLNEIDAWASDFLRELKGAGGTLEGE